jgi:hypothetical protein
MIRRFTIASIVALSLLIVTARAIGSTNKPPALALLDPGDCPQPCWHGIQPGVTKMEAAKMVLKGETNLANISPPTENHGGCWRTTTPVSWVICVGANSGAEKLPGRVDDITFWPSEGTLRLSDAVNLFGTPTSVYSCPTISGLKTNLAGPHRAITVMFGTYGTGVIYKPSGLSDNPTATRVTLDMIVYDLTFVRASNFSPNLIPQSQRWRGFTRLPMGNYLCSTYYIGQ